MKRKETKRRLVQAYLETNSIRKTVQLRGTSQHVVGKWVRLLGQVAFLFWLVLVNVLYYAQFKDLFLARLKSLLELWR